MQLKEVCAIERGPVHVTDPSVPLTGPLVPLTGPRFPLRDLFNFLIVGQQSPGFNCTVRGVPKNIVLGHKYPNSSPGSQAQLPRRPTVPRLTEASRDRQTGAMATPHPEHHQEHSPQQYRWTMRFPRSLRASAWICSTLLGSSGARPPRSFGSTCLDLRWIAKLPGADGTSARR